MNSAIEKLYSLIGHAALRQADDLAGKLLVYAEVEEGVISADIFYVNRAGVVRFRFGSSAIQELIYSFWENWKSHPGNTEWRAMSMAIDGTHFNIDLTYPDQLNSQENILERRPELVMRHFGDLRVDYSDPG